MPEGEYEPKPEEIANAEEMMTDEEKQASQEREEGAENHRFEDVINLTEWCRDILETQVMLIYEGYDLKDEGSQSLRNTFGSMIYYALGHERQHDFCRAVSNFFRDKGIDIAAGPPTEDERHLLWGQREEMREFLHTRAFLKGVSILDIGCGQIGIFARLLNDMGATVIGIDPQVRNDDSIVKYGDIIKHLPKGVYGKQFDFVLSTMTFEGEVGIPAKEGLENATKLVGKDGYLIISPKIGTYHIDRLTEGNYFLDLSIKGVPATVLKRRKEIQPIGQIKPEGQIKLSYMGRLKGRTDKT